MCPTGCHLWNLFCTPLVAHLHLLIFRPLGTSVSSQWILASSPPCLSVCDLGKSFVMYIWSKIWIVKLELIEWLWFHYGIAFMFDVKDRNLESQNIVLLHIGYS